MTYRLLRVKQVLELTGISRAHLYRMMERDTFPLSVQIGLKARAWRSDEVQAWVESRPRTGRKVS